MNILPRVTEYPACGTSARPDAKCRFPWERHDQTQLVVNSEANGEGAK
jgi:hypothetical protein